VLGRRLPRLDRRLPRGDAGLAAGADEFLTKPIDRDELLMRAGNLLALMGVGNLATSLVVPVLAHRRPGQRALVVPSLVGTAAGLAGCLWAPLGMASLWVLVLGVSQGACLGLAIFFMLARAPDAEVAASLSAFAQSVGYLVASAGPLVVGLLLTAIASGTIVGRTGKYRMFPIAGAAITCVACMECGVASTTASTPP